MHPFLVAGALSFATGLAFVIFRKPIGITFCKVGKGIFRNSPYRGFFPFESIYDEEKGPRNICFMGVLFMLQSPVFVLFGFLF
jgi:hypothetical protein